MEDQPDNGQSMETGAEPAVQPSAASSESGDSNGSSGMSTGMKVGIGIGILVAALLLILIFMQLTGGAGSSVPEETVPEVPIAPTATVTTAAGSGGETGAGENPDGGIIIVVPTPVPGDPTVTANTSVYIRNGPGTQYAIIGAMAEGETALAVGRTAAGDWWAISHPEYASGIGWVSAQYVTATDADGVPTVQPPPAPAPTATPVVPITDWKGEYFNNPNLQGNPVLVRNDPRIDFNWGTGSPAPEVPNDKFSVRWTMSRNAPRGIYEFSAWVDDGIRVWVDEQLIINGWATGTARNYTAQVEVADGAHTVRVEYFEDTGGALVSLNIAYRGEGVPQAPTAVISGPTEGMVGEELLYAAQGSTVAQGSHIVSTEWDFGDGATDKGAQVVHVYTAPGVYTILLVLADDKGLSGNATQQVRIVAAPEIDTPEPTEAPTEIPTEVPTEAPPEATEVAPPTASIIAPAEAGVDELVIFDGSASVSANPIQEFVWDMGDGTPAEGPVVEHAYVAQGAYTVTLTVVDDAGLSDETSVQIQIVPAVAAPLPAAADTPEPVEEGAAGSD